MFTLTHDPHRRRRRWLERRAIWICEDTDDRDVGTFESGNQLIDSEEALASFVLSVPTRAADADSLRHSRGIERQRPRHRDNRAVAFLAIGFAKPVEDELSIHDLQAESSAWRQHPYGFTQDGVVLVIGLEKPERVHHDYRVGALG